MVAACVLLSILGALIVFQRSLLFQPDTGVPESEWPFRTVVIHTEDGLDLDTWLFEPSGTSRDIAVLVAPGNAGNRGGRAGLAHQLADLGYTAMLLEYRGYGGNPGSPTEEGLAMDARAAARALRDLGFTPERTIYLGESLGTGVVVRLATTDPPAAILLRSPFTSMVDVAQRQFPLIPVGLFLRDRFDTLEYLTQVHSPITVMYGSNDQLVPPAQSVAVAAATPRLFASIEVSAEHNDIFWLGPDLPAQLDKMARAVIGA